ncbi:hypothetical protein GCM10025867_04180 [Frondihabitans sucicola]|uniref:Polysaccharide biosynthesis protein n=1 Tax=Frondihabitans sucicola TaxID=1268041 RepID=A0ABN6XT42_9MICO|nr:hypothetical protein [Frondihabitans sucicola]BDZ48177.1 hypothetical protein GCM10025867_04180 [Frondihabitans sucicola]
MGVVGPQRVAKSPRGRLGIYRRAQACKLIATAVLAPAAALLTAALVQTETASAALLAGATVLTALSPAWFFVGTHRPGLTLACDTIPRVGLSVAAAAAIALGGGLAFYGAALVAAAAIGVILAGRLGGLPVMPRRRDFTRAPSTIREHSALVAGRAVSTVYTSLPSAFLGVVAPAGVAAYTALDRPLRMGFGILGAVPARLQSFVGVADEAVARRRSIVAIGVNAAVGIAAATIFVLVMPLVVPVLFSGAVDVDFTLVALGAALLVVMSTSRGLGLSLVAAGAAPSISVAIVAAASTAVVTLPSSARPAVPPEQ